MCGIAGIISFSGEESIIRHIFHMQAKMRHRGSDDEGFTFISNDNFLCLAGEKTPDSVIGNRLNYTPSDRSALINSDHRLVLAHNRLSVIDISHYGHQPMCEENERYWIVYNGEVYNFPEIKDELSALGHKFRTGTDTEVVLKSFVQWGNICVHKFNGMWAFAIYDTKEKSLFASRDRFGVKPFYYIHNNNTFAFASEQKALYHFPGSGKELNHTAVFDYLAMGKLELEEEGIVGGLMELPPSHMLNLDLDTGRLKVEKYYDLGFEPGWGSYSAVKAEEYRISLIDHLREAIRIRLNSDVPVGTCLSGGIDSSILVCQVNQFLQHLLLASIEMRQHLPAAIQFEYLDSMNHILL